MIDLDDTEACPRADACEGCGTPRPLLVTTAQTMVGVYCVTLCPSCALQSSLPGSALAAAVKRAAGHCAHLGITVDEMAAAMEDN